MAVEAAHLFVTVDADVDKAMKGLGRVNDASQKSEGFLKGAAKQAIGFGTAMVGIQVGAMAFDTITGAAIGMNSTLETSTLQFETLMGDADKAKKHVEGLFDFAAKTPFETGPIIEASRIMETFGGAALNSKDNLTLFGDAAAATGQPINDVGFWMSRAYADIQAGRPFGEAAMRLAEMGVITPQVRNNLEDLQKKGAEGPAIWEELTGSLGRFDGAMEKQSGTFSGMLATFTDSVNMLLAKALYPLFDAVKQGLAFFNDLLSGTTSLEGAMSNLGQTIIDGVQAGILWLWEEGIPLGAAALAGLAEKFIAWVGPATEQLGAELPKIAGTVINWLAANLPNIIAKLGEWAIAFVGWIGKNVLPKLPGALAAVGGAILRWIAATAPVVASRMVQMAFQMVQGFITFLTTQLIPKFIATIGSLIGQIPALAGRLASAAVKMGGNFVSGFIRGLASLPGKIADVIRSAFRNLRIDIGPFHINASGVTIDLPNINLPSFATGAWNLPRDMVAQVHAGEMIVPRDIAERLRGGRGFGGGGPEYGGGYSGGNTNVTVYVGTFVGTEENVSRLSQELGRTIRTSTPRRTATATSR